MVFSGYTESLAKTELVHSSHIINELLEAVLADYKLGLETIQTLCEKP